MKKYLLRKIFTLFLLCGLIAPHLHFSITKVDDAKIKSIGYNKKNADPIEAEYRLIKKKFRLKGVEVISPLVSGEVYIREFKFKGYAKVNKTHFHRNYQHSVKTERGPPTV